MVLLDYCIFVGSGSMKRSCPLAVGGLLTVELKFFCYWCEKKLNVFGRVVCINLLGLWFTVCLKCVVLCSFFHIVKCYSMRCANQIFILKKSITPD